MIKVYKFLFYAKTSPRLHVVPRTPLRIYPHPRAYHHVTRMSRDQSPDCYWHHHILEFSRLACGSLDFGSYV